MKTGEHETPEPMGGRVAGNTTAYGYDDSDRLTSAVTENPLDVVIDDYTYDYEQVGNRVLEIISTTRPSKRPGRAGPWHH